MTRPIPMDPFSDAGLRAEYGSPTPGCLWTVAVPRVVAVDWYAGTMPADVPAASQAQSLRKPFRTLDVGAFAVQTIRAVPSADMIDGDGVLSLLVGERYFLTCPPTWCPISTRKTPLVIPARQWLSVELLRAQQGALLVVLEGAYYGVPSEARS